MWNSITTLHFYKNGSWKIMNEAKWLKENKKYTHWDSILDDDLDSSTFLSDKNLPSKKRSKKEIQNET